MNRDKVIINIGVIMDTCARRITGYKSVRLCDPQACRYIPCKIVFLKNSSYAVVVKLCIRGAKVGAEMFFVRVSIYPVAGSCSMCNAIVALRVRIKAVAIQRVIPARAVLKCGVLVSYDQRMLNWNAIERGIRSWPYASESHWYGGVRKL